MNTNITVNIPNQIQEYLWTRYMPETTYKLYMMIGYLNQENVEVEKAQSILLNASLENEVEIGQIKDEKEAVLSKLGYKYPTTREEDLKLLLDFKLIAPIKDEKSNVSFVYLSPIKPEDVLNIDDAEKENLSNIRFEIVNQHTFDMFLTLLLNSNGNISSTIEHIQKTTNTKLSSLKEVLLYLEKEGSINIKSTKATKDLRKSDKVYISIVKDVFESKRFVLK